MKRKLNRDKVLLMASAHNISTVYKVDNNSLDTWVGKTKGLLDVCYEQGVLDIDTFYFKDLNEKFQKDSYGQIIEGKNISVMLGRCNYFTEEYTLLQTHCKAIGVKCDRSPKFHPEVAGEGIEYSWENSKMVLQRIPPKNRNSVADFRLQVKRVLSKGLLSIDRLQTNSRRARE